MATLPHNSLPDSPPSQDADGDASNQTIEAPVSPPMVSSERDVPSRETEATEHPDLNEQLRAGLLLQLQLTASRFRAVDMRLELVSPHLMRYESYDSTLLNAAGTFRRMTGESEVVIQAGDVNGLSVVQNIALVSNIAEMEFDMAMSKLKACRDGLDKIEQETAVFLEFFDTTSTLLTAEDVKALETLRNVPGETRLRRAKILMEVRSYW
ncbi:hypothetical protein KCV07_g1543, partial [Aureobasidium melanogenum]